METKVQDKNKNEKAVSDIMKICKDLNIKIDTKKTAEANKFLSAWHKSQI